jgi:GT2 family glycosyltransferase/spore maturation protein CgeB
VRSADRAPDGRSSGAGGPAGAMDPRDRLLHSEPVEPSISLIVLAWNQLPLTQACVRSIREGATGPIEVVIVDNGSEPEAAQWASDNADVAVLLSSNTGFSHGMNSGLQVASAPVVAFVNNDTVFPRGWDAPLLETIAEHPDAGIVLPAVTAAGNPASVRSEPGTERVVFEPFGHLPSGVVYLMHTDMSRALGGFDERYELATGEDLDLLFTVWANGLEVVLDTRVLVEHVSESSRRLQPGMEARQRENLRIFLDRWKASDPPPIRLGAVSEEEFHRNLMQASVAAIWLERLVDARRSAGALRSVPGRPDLEAKVVELERQLGRERQRVRSLTNRRSVRLALKAASLAKPVVGAIRGRKASGETAEQPKPTEREVTEAIRRHRPELGPEHGPLVSMIVLTRDGAHHLRRLLRGLAENTRYRSFEVIVVDNASTDDTSAVLGQDWGFPVKVISNEFNAGFSTGCNQGLAISEGEYALLLNNDVDPINPGWLGAMVSALGNDLGLGAVGALLVYPERPGYDSGDPNTGADLTVQHRGVRLTWRRNAEPRATVPWAYNIGVGEDPTDRGLAATTEVPAVTAACLLAPTGLLRQIGGLDEAFVYGMEDVDLCIRIRQAGRRIATVGSAALYHHEFGTQSQIASARKRATGLANLQHFSEKWAPLLSRLLDLEAITPSSRPLRHHPGGRIAITVTRDDPAAGWGDWYTAHELGDALEAVGFRVVYAEGHRDHWYQLDDDVVAVICLMDAFDARRAPAGALTIAWVRNWTHRWIEQPWFGSHDVYIPSSAVTADLLVGAGVEVTPVIPLATNTDRFHPHPPNAAYANDFVVTANYWRAARPGIQEIVVRPDERFSVFGKGWEEVPRLSRYARGPLPYDELPQVYSSSRIVVDETAGPTLPYGAVNSRVFDALACGALVITNNRIGSDELFDGELPAFDDITQQRSLLDRYLGDETLRAETAARLRARVVGHHTYGHRAVEIPALVREMVMRPRISLTIGTPDETVAAAWGDTHFAEALAGALRRRGARASIRYLDAWDAPASQETDAVVHIRGLGSYVPKRSHLNILWVISHPDQVTPEECETYDMVLVASARFAEELSGRVSVPVEVMYQATDPARFAPNPDPALASRTLFVGNTRGQRRSAVDAAIEAGIPVTVYGEGWDDLTPPAVHAASHFPNDRLATLYSSADVVLNDHWPDMARLGFVSNRIFDVIASGGTLFTDPVSGLTELFGDLVPVFDSAETLASLLAEREAHPEVFDERMRQARGIVLAEHTFDARASRILEILGGLGLGQRFDDSISRSFGGPVSP